MSLIRQRDSSASTDPSRDHVTHGQEKELSASLVLSSNMQSAGERAFVVALREIARSNSEGTYPLLHPAYGGNNQGDQSLDLGRIRFADDIASLASNLSSPATAALLAFESLRFGMTAPGTSISVGIEPLSSKWGRVKQVSRRDRIVPICLATLSIVIGSV
jgi:hypothetical protein